MYSLSCTTSRENAVMHTRARPNNTARLVSRRAATPRRGTATAATATRRAWAAWAKRPAASIGSGGGGGCSGDNEDGSDEDAAAGEGGSHEARERLWPEAR